MSASGLKKYRILIADQDRELADVLSQMLQNMGFSVPHVIRSGREALNALNKRNYDFLITEWNTEQLSGIDMIKKIRVDSTSPCPTLPVIMLTGRAEKIDVIAARDAGVNEYVIKPFSAKAVYSRIERIIEQPRKFVVAEKFVGSDRRGRGKLPHSGKDKRKHVMRPNPNPQSISAKTISAGDVPRLWTPDYGLKAKLGTGVTLQSIITPEVLDHAQAAIQTITQNSLEWIKEDFQTLEALVKRLNLKPVSIELVSEIGETALSISSRAGTFEYEHTAKIAYMLYLFCRNHLQPGNDAHATIVQKHVDVFYVIMSQRLLGKSNEMADEIIEGLRVMTEKLT